MSRAPRSNLAKSRIILRSRRAFDERLREQ
jgi:hypothetical protein